MFKYREILFFYWAENERVQPKVSTRSLVEKNLTLSGSAVRLCKEAGLTFLPKHRIMGGIIRGVRNSPLCVWVRVWASSSASSLGIDFTRVIDGFAAAALLPSPITHRNTLSANSESLFPSDSPDSGPSSSDTGGTTYSAPVGLSGKYSHQYISPLYHPFFLLSPLIITLPCFSFPSASHSSRHTHHLPSILAMMRRWLWGPQLPLCNKTASEGGRCSSPTAT